MVTAYQGRAGHYPGRYHHAGLAAARLGNAEWRWWIHGHQASSGESVPGAAQLRLSLA
jgi:hypothetical protein